MARHDRDHFGFWEAFVPFQAGFDRPSHAKPIGMSGLAQMILEELLDLALHEGVMIELVRYRWQYPENAGPEAYPVYDKWAPSITIDLTRDWVQVRWQLAFGLGLHFTSHIFDERGYDDWERAAETWATQYLATRTAVITDRRGFYRHPTIPQGLDHRLWDEMRYRKDRSRICSARTREGKPCQSSRLAGSCFCHSHQDAQLESLPEILGGLRWRPSDE